MGGSTTRGSMDPRCVLPDAQQGAGERSEEPDAMTSATGGRCRVRSRGDPLQGVERNGDVLLLRALHPTVPFRGRREERALLFEKSQERAHPRVGAPPAAGQEALRELALGPLVAVEVAMQIEGCSSLLERKSCARHGQAHEGATHVASA